MANLSLDKQVRQVPKKYYCYRDSSFGFQKHVWSAMFLSVAHFLGIHGFIMLLTGQVPRTVFLFSLFHAYFVGFGTTIGAHRLWSHKTFKAKLPLQIILAYMQTAAGQNPIFQWCRDHRLHHKYSETDADPHDTRRSFWFAHVGWVLQKEHPAVKEKEASIDMSDLDNDPVVKFQAKYYWYLFFVAYYAVPIYCQHLVWPQLSMYQLISLNYVWYLISVHGTWMINSAAHRWGSKPFEKAFDASDNSFVALMTFGEGWHNWHHCYPWDYRSSEFGFYTKNWSIIDFLAWLGLAYDLKTVNKKTVMARAKRTGDGSYPQPELQSIPTWGWGDKDITTHDYQVTEHLRTLAG